MWISVDQAHRSYIKWREYKQNIGIGISENSPEWCGTVVVDPIMSTAKTGPLLFVGHTRDGLLRPVRRDVERLPGQEPARADPVMHSLTQQMHFGTTRQEFSLEPQCDAGICKISSKTTCNISIRPGDFPVVFACRTGREQHVQQVHVASARRSMVVVNPPGTPRDHAARAQFQRFRPLRVADPAKPASRIIVKILDVRSHVSEARLLIRILQLQAASTVTQF